MTTALKAGIALAALGALAWVGGCGGDHIGPKPSLPPDTSAVIVSDLVSAPTATRLRFDFASTGASGGSVVYVSLLPGTVARGSSVRIEDRAGIGLFQGSLTHGGLNPVPVPALVGDTLFIVATDSAGNITTASQVVRPIRAVRVVRVEPTGGTDVPLNASILAVFSEPLAPSTVTPQTVRLLQNGQPVAGAPLLAPDGFEVAFQPASSLAPLTPYELSITTGITSALGASLAQETRVAFTTGSQPGALASLSVSPGFALILQGGTLQLTAEAKDAAGNIIAPPGPVSWALDSGIVLAVSQTGFLTTRGGISVDGVTATVATFSARAYPLSVEPPTSVSIAGTWDWTEQINDLAGTICSDTGTMVFSQVGGGFTGTAQQVGHCASASGTVDNSGSFQVRYGSVGGSAGATGHVTFGFLSKGCTYDASFIGTAPTSLSGTFVTCSGSSAGGTWGAARRP